jgi:hypothetical protein
VELVSSLSVGGSGGDGSQHGLGARCHRGELQVGLQHVASELLLAALLEETDQELPPLQADVVRRTESLDGLTSRVREARLLDDHDAEVVVGAASGLEDGPDEVGLLVCSEVLQQVLGQALLDQEDLPLIVSEEAKIGSQLQKGRVAGGDADLVNCGLGHE